MAEILGAATTATKLFLEVNKCDLNRDKYDLLFYLGKSSKYRQLDV